MQGDAVALLGGDQAVQLGLGDGVAVVGGAVGLATGDLGEQGFVFRLPLVFRLLVQGKVDAAVVGDVGIGGVAEMSGGKAEVFGGTAEADKQFAVVGINGGETAAEIWADGDVVFCYGELPGLGVVPRWGAGGGFYDGADGLGVGHGGILFLGLLLWGL